jgi:hypothetical protein
MTRVVCVAVALAALVLQCSPAASTEPETPVPPGPLEPEHQGQFVPSGNEPLEPAPKAVLVDGGSPR